MVVDRPSYGKIILSVCANREGASVDASYLEWHREDLRCLSVIDPAQLVAMYRATVKPAELEQLDPEVSFETMIDAIIENEGQLWHPADESPPGPELLG